MWREAGHEVQELGRDGGDASEADVLLVAVPGPEIGDALARVTGLVNRAGLGPFFVRYASPGEL